MAEQVFVAVDLGGEGGDPGRLGQLVRLVEEAGVALVTFADEPATPASRVPRIEAGVRAAFVSATTTRTGLAPALPVTTTEPFHLATQLASLDHASHGRAAWLVEAPNDAAAHATIGREPLTAEELRQETRDVVDVARQLWDSWEDDAIIRDAATGRYLDADKVHHVDFRGRSFGVKGPLITPRPPQGQIVVIAREELGLGERADITLVDEPVERPGITVLDLPVSLPGAVSATALAQRLKNLAGTVDGVRLRPEAPAADLPLIADTVLPALGGALRRPQSGSFRSFLGLNRPASRYAKA